MVDDLEERRRKRARENRAERVSGLFTRIPVYPRNLAILALISLLITLGVTGSRVSASVISTVVSFLLVAMLLAIAATIWNQNKGTFDLMPRPKRYLLYAAVLGIGALILAQRFFVQSLLLSVLWFLAIAGLGFVVYRIWQESRRYHY